MTPKLPYALEIEKLPTRAAGHVKEQELDEYLHLDDYMERRCGKGLSSLRCSGGKRRRLESRGFASGMG